jgi:PAS domain-containing protein
MVKILLILRRAFDCLLHERCVFRMHPLENKLELIFQRIHPDDRELVRQTIDRGFEARANLDFEHRLLMPDCSVKYLHPLARAEETSSGTLEYVGTVMDVTERKRAEKERDCSRYKRILRT